MSRPVSTCIPGDFYCKCEGCRYLISLAWVEIPEGVKLLNLIKDHPPPVPQQSKCDFCSEFCGNDWCCVKEEK